MRVFALAFLAAKLWGKPVISLNQSFVVNHAADLAVAVNVFNAFSLNSFREKKSWAVANENGLHSSVLCPDFAFLDATEKAGKGPAGLEGDISALRVRLHWKTMPLTIMRKRLRF